MSLCSGGNVACGTAGCLASTMCCQADLGYGCATGRSCFTNAGSIGCLRTTATMPSGPRPCFSYAEGGSLSGGCGTANWCQYCSQTEYPQCFTNIVLGGQIPLTAISCDSSNGVLTFTASPVGSIISSSSPTVTSASRTYTSVTYTPPTYSTPRTYTLPTSTGTSPISPTITSPPTPGQFQSALPPISSTSSNPSPSKLSSGAIAGIAIGAFLAIAIIGILLFLLLRKKRGGPAFVPPPPPQPVASPALPGYPAYGDQNMQQGYGGGGNMGTYGYTQPVTKTLPSEVEG